MSSKLLDLDLDPDERTLRQFGFIALGGFGLLAACAFYETWMFGFGLGAARAGVALALGALAGLATLFSLVYPRANKWIYLTVAILAYPIGFVLSYVIMAFLFFGVFAPIGAVLRLAGKEPLQRTLMKDRPSYWTPSRRLRSKESYFRQF